MGNGIKIKAKSEWYDKKAPQKRAKQASGLGGKLLDSAAEFLSNKEYAKGTGMGINTKIGDVDISAKYDKKGSDNGGKKFGIQATYRF